VSSAFLSVPAFSQDIVDPASVWERATLYRDEWGTPHIYADDFQALAFAFGWAQAEDHLEPMLAAYRIANGRGAEIYGESMAESDEFALKLGHGMLARSAFPNLDPVTQELCVGFATGVNAWIVGHPEQTPAWADGVNPEDILALLHCYLMSFAPFDLPGSYRRGAPAITGNAWAVSPARSATGAAILAINPHEYYDGPFRWYEAHLVCQNMNVSGATLFGLPVIMQGHNESLGWALTPNQPDFADIFIEPPFGIDLNRDPKSVMAGAQTQSSERLLHMMMLANTRTYFVATPDGPVERAVVCLDTARGPVVSVDGARILSYQIGGYRDFGTIAQLAAMACAQDLPAFQSALTMHQLPCFHVVYADGAGNIFYLYNAKMGDKPAVEVPLQIEEETIPPAVIDWTTPMLASRFGWGDIIPPEALPAVVNPASGYLQACGNPPWAATENSGILAETFPQWFCADRDTFRAQRVRRLLGAGQRSPSDFQAMLFDPVAPLAADVVPLILSAAEERKDTVANSHPDTSIGIAALKNWNYAADVSSAGMTFFHAWWASLQAQDLSTVLAGKDFIAALKEKSPAAQDAAINAAADAARMMRNEFNSLTVPWGDVHTLTRGGKEAPVAGSTSGEPIFVSGDFVYDSKKWRANYGFAYAMVVSFGEQLTASSLLPFGASENPASAHYADQLALMTSGRLKPAWFSIEDVQRNAATARGRIVHLRPGGMEGLFALQAEQPIEAQLDTAVEAPAELPAGLAPFTLFVKPEQTPRAAPVQTNIEIRIPEVLCSSQDLEKLSVYAHDGAAKEGAAKEGAAKEGAAWKPLEQQELNQEIRTFSAYDDQPGQTYCVLGPAQLRAERIPIPGEPDTPALPPQVESSAPQAENVPQQNERKWWWGLVPQPLRPQPSPRPVIRPPGSKTPAPENVVGEPELPKLDIAPPIIPTDAVDEAREAGGEEKRVRRNYNVQLPGARERQTAADLKKEERKAKKQAAQMNRQAKKNKKKTK